MRIAWVTPYLPEPATSGGVIRQQHLARALAARAEVHLFARGECWEASRLRSPELDFFATRWSGRDYWSLAPSPSPMRPPRRVRRGSPRSLWRALREVHARRPFDGVVVCHSWAALGAESLGIPWLLDEHNVESRFFRELAGAHHANNAPSEQHALERWERRTWREASTVTCVCAEDAASVNLHRNVPYSSARAARVVQNGADLQHLDGQNIAEHRGGVLFVGALHHPPNSVAAERLIERIMPRVWRTLPSLPLTIVGGPVPESLYRAAERAAGNVLLRGQVPDVTPYLAGERVFVNPVTHGAGSSLKTIEALAAGIPLVSTELGARGYELEADRHYLSAASDAEFAEATLSVLHDEHASTMRVQAARRHAMRFGWQRLGADFAEHVGETVAEPRPKHRAG